MINIFSFIKSIDLIVKFSGPEDLYQWKENFKAIIQRYRLWMHFDSLINRKFIKKLMLILLIYDLYLDVKSEDAASISKFLNERYNTIQYNKNYKEWKTHQSRIEEA
jgi:hypothetical protein